MDDNFHFANTIRGFNASVYIHSTFCGAFAFNLEGKKEATSLMMAKWLSHPPPPPPKFIGIYRWRCWSRSRVVGRDHKIFYPNGFLKLELVNCHGSREVIIGVKQEGGLGWSICRIQRPNRTWSSDVDAAPNFWHFILWWLSMYGRYSVCESKAAKGDRSWWLLPQTLMTELGNLNLFIESGQVR